MSASDSKQQEMPGEWKEVAAWKNYQLSSQFLFHFKQVLRYAFTCVSHDILCVHVTSWEAQEKIEVNIIESKT